MSKEDSRVLDVAIVGGGISGLYAAYKLQVISDRRIAIFEAASRIGGRICTGRFSLPLQASSGAFAASSNINSDDFYPEFGPMRIEPEHQILLQGLLNELGIKEESLRQHDSNAGSAPPQLVDFPAYASPITEYEPEYPLKGEEKIQDTPLDLLKLGLVRIFGRVSVNASDQIKEKTTTPTDTHHADENKFHEERSHLKVRLGALLNALSLSGASRQPDWKQDLQGWIDELTEADLQNIRDYVAFDEIPLHQMGFWNLLSEVLSHTAVMKLRDLGTFYHLIPENPNAAEWLLFWLRALKTTDKLQGIDTGMEKIIERLEAKIRTKHGDIIYMGKRLLRLQPRDKKVELWFEGESEPYVAEHVLLALPKAPLQKIVTASGGAFDQDIRDAVDAVFGFPLLKVFVVVKRRWWEEEQRANFGATRIPTRELHYWKSKTPGSTRGMVMVYTDRPGSSYWANYVAKRGSQDGPQTTAYLRPWTGAGQENTEAFAASQTARLKAKVIQLLREVGGERVKESDIEGYGIMDWGREPYAGAAHAWRPERHATAILKRLSSFGLIGSARVKEDGCNVHICGEAYSDYQAFIEGSLRSAAHVLHKIDPDHQLVIDETVAKARPIKTVTPWLCDCDDCKMDASRRGG